MKNFYNHVAAFGKKLTFLVAFLSISAFAFAQQRVTGTVTDANGEPVIGASVIVEGTTTGTTTGIDGTYTISAPAQANLVFAFLGYKEQVVAVAGKTTIDVTLTEDVASLDEVVVIGYGTVKKRDLTGAVSSVKSEELTASPVANAIEAMQGRVAGLDITRDSGKAGSGTSILLRGNRSLTAGHIFDYLTLYAVTVRFTSRFEHLGLADVDTDGCVEFQCASACGGLGVTVDNAHLLTQLVNKDNDAVSL